LDLTVIEEELGDAAVLTKDVRLSRFVHGYMFPPHEGGKGFWILDLEK
jgi:hypothetical protein